MLNQNCGTTLVSQLLDSIDGIIQVYPELAEALKAKKELAQQAEEQEEIEVLEKNTNQEVIIAPKPTQPTTPEPTFDAEALTLLGLPANARAHEILGVAEDASLEQINAQYKKLALQWHPDKVRQQTRFTEAEFNKAFKVIGEARGVMIKRLEERVAGTS